MFKAPRHLEEYLKFKYGTDFMEEKPNFGPAENIIVPKNEYVAYTCGVFDLFHIGHLNLLKRIKDNFDKVIVGVHNDQDVMSYKNKPTIPYSDRLEIIKSCKYVDCVYENAEVITTGETLIKLNADYVIAGRENEQFISKHYPVDFRSLHLIERTSNISTSLIKSNLHF
jgi:cytidyltransferase-like protein